MWKLLLGSVIVILVLSGCATTDQKPILPIKRPPESAPANIEAKPGDDPVSIVSPLDRFSARVTKKPFGIYITSENSPIQPERFSGYHTGVDLEVFADELDKEVEVLAFCQGQLRQTRRVGGYGGVVIQECLIDDQLVTVLYGHLDIVQSPSDVGLPIDPGMKIGILGDDKSIETDGERKHLHFAIHKGQSINYRGYVNTETELEQWIDPEIYLK